MHVLESASGTESLSDLPRLLENAEGWVALRAAPGRQRPQALPSSMKRAWGSSAALAAAALALDAPKTLLVVLAHPGDVEAWRYDLQSFGGQMPPLFPAWESWPPERTRLDDVASQRLRVLKTLSTAPPRIILTTIGALMQPVPSKEEMAARGRRLRVGDTIDVDELSHWLVDRGFKRVDAVELSGEFSKRGGIVDLFSADAEDPYRIELFGDEIESMRQFSAQTQRSLGALTEAVIFTNSPGAVVGDKRRARQRSPTIFLPIRGSRSSIRTKSKNRPSSFSKASLTSPVSSRPLAFSGC